MLQTTTKNPKNKLKDEVSYKQLALQVGKNVFLRSRIDWALKMTMADQKFESWGAPRKAKITIYFLCSIML